MQFALNLEIPPLQPLINYSDSFLLIGSCFTEHISDRLQQHKFKVCSNPHGILFNPFSVADSLDSYVANKVYTEDDLFFLNELWNSWSHHTRFSHTDKNSTLENINASIAQAAKSIREVNYVIITLGSAFQYYLKEQERPVANNHRAPGQWFEKRLLSTQQIVERLQHSLQQIRSINPKVRFIFTVSPVRHIRDGVVANNRSKARLLEAVHQLCENDVSTYYFPAYELVIDVLRDYRFYDIDFVHPNYMATQFVWEQFMTACIAPDTQSLMEKVAALTIAQKHRSRFPQTNAHQNFLRECLKKIEQLKTTAPFLDFGKEEKYFESELLKYS
jgi:hypothetical protein